MQIQTETHFFAIFKKEIVRNRQYTAKWNIYYVKSKEKRNERWKWQIKKQTVENTHTSYTLHTVITVTFKN